MMRGDEIEALVREFHSAGKILTARTESTDEEMITVDKAQAQRLEALQALVKRKSPDGAARLLGMTTEDVEDELRVDRTIE